MKHFMFQILNWRLFLFCLMGTAAGCGDAADDGSNSQCRDAECFGVCIENGAWDGLTESYWRFDAFCKDAKTCQCLNGCDNDRCNDYCVNEKGGTSGTCDIFSCECFGVIADAGDFDDAGTNTSR